MAVVAERRGPPALRRALGLLPQAVRDRVIRSFIRIDEDEIRSVRVKVASTVSEYEQAARLVHDSYVRRGILEPQTSGLRVTPHQFSPANVVFVAKQGDEVVGTISLLVDSDNGLPMEDIYADAVEALRGRGRKLAEVGALSVARRSRGAGVVYLLNRLMADCAREVIGVDDLVVAVHPDVEDLYRAALCFERIGPVKRYPGLNKSALAVALRLDLIAGRAYCQQHFGHAAKTAANPYYLYFERENPQIEPLVCCRASMNNEVVRRIAAVRFTALTTEPPPQATASTLPSRSFAASPGFTR